VLPENKSTGDIHLQLQAPGAHWQEPEQQLGFLKFGVSHGAVKGAIGSYVPAGRHLV